LRKAKINSKQKSLGRSEIVKLAHSATDHKIHQNGHFAQFIQAVTFVVYTPQSDFFDKLGTDIDLLSQKARVCHPLSFFYQIFDGWERWLDVEVVQGFLGSVAEIGQGP
jgi:hypothetical protein